MKSPILRVLLISLIAVAAFGTISNASIPSSLSGLNENIVEALELKALLGDVEKPILIAFTAADMAAAGAVHDSLQGMAAKSSRNHFKHMKKKGNQLKKQHKKHYQDQEE